jgi:hypothetical protein
MLNKCTPNLELIKGRHNSVAKVVEEAVLRFHGPNLLSDISQDKPVLQEGLAEDLRIQRPDMFFVRQTREGPVLEIIEFSCPYGYICPERDVMQAIHEQKTRKYERLVTELKALRQGSVNLTAVIISSMGAVYPRSLRDLQMILGCNDRETRKLGKRMSDAALAGSMRIWFDVMRNRDQRVRYGKEGDTLIAQEVEEVNTPGRVEDERREEEEDETEDESERDRRGERRDEQEAIEDDDPAEEHERSGSGQERDDREVRREGGNREIANSDEHSVREEAARRIDKRHDELVGLAENPGDDEGDEAWSV